MGHGGLCLCRRDLYADAHGLRGDESPARKMSRAVGVADAHEGVCNLVTRPARGLKRHSAYAARRAVLVNGGAVGTGYFNREDRAVGAFYQLIGVG